LIGSRKAKNQEETAMVLDKALREACVSIKQDADVLLAYQKGRALAAEMGFSNEDQMIVVIAIMEVARNIVRYAEQGEVSFSTFQQGGRHGLRVVARDSGPGIPSIERALENGYSTGGGLGLGLSGAKRLMDEFEITSQVGQGTTIEMKKWK
jgi:serine/threonine-protein kinase RsbT